MTKRKKISMKDISKELGISTTTISFIINNKAENKISKEVIQRVEEYIHKVGYRPNSSAQSLRTGKSKTIVFMAENISDPFFSAIARQMEELAFGNGYRIIYCSTENKRERALELLELFKNREVEAFIITPPEDFENELRDLIYKDQQTVMVFDRHYSSFEHNYVVINNLQHAKEASQRLYEAGGRNLAYVGIASELSPLVERKEGYLECLAENGLPEYSLQLGFEEIGTHQGHDKLKAFFDANPQLDSVLFATNKLAIDGLRVLNSMNLSIPEDMAVLSFDDRELFELYSPPIGVVCQPVTALANELIKGTLQLITQKGKPSYSYKKVLEGKLIPRQSLRPVKVSCSK